MAIDTAAKRRSVASVAFLPLGEGVTPDATPGVEWRQQVGWGYSGIAAGADGGEEDTPFWCSLTGMSGMTGGSDIGEF